MKKILSAIVLIIAFMMTSVTFAQNDFENNKRYIACPVGMGLVSYIDTASVSVQEYRPPQYIIAINTIRKYDQDTNNAHLRFHTFKFKYDYTKRKMYLYSPNHGESFKGRYLSDRKSSKKPIDTSIDWNSDWQYVDPDVYYGEGTGDIVVAGEIAFAVAYNLKFHGEKYMTFQNGFYAKLPNAAKIKTTL